MGINIIGIISGIFIIGGLALIYALNKKAPQNASEQPRDDTFLHEMLAVLQDVYPDSDFSYDRASDTISPIASENKDNAPFLDLFLGNLRNRTLELGKADRKDFLRKFLEQAAQSGEVTIDALRESVLMRNRTPEEFSLRQLLMSPEGGKDPFEPIIIAKGEMLFEPVLNLENSVSPISVQTMREHGFAFDEFIQMASQNLLSVTPEGSANMWEKLEDDIWISKLNDDFDASRVFLFPEHLELPFEGNPVVYAPSHTVCLITDQFDDATLARVVELGNASAETHRPLSRALWHRDTGEWRRMESDDRNSAVGRARLIETLAAYDEQKNGLEQHFDKTQQDIHVAAVMAQSDNTDPAAPKIETRAVFIGKGSYLPKTDFVILGFEEMSDKTPIDQVDWGTLENILGEENFKPHPDLLPVRYQLETDLSDSQIKALRNAATHL